MIVVHVGQCGFFRKNFGGVTSLSLHLSRRCFYGPSFCVSFNLSLCLFRDSVEIPSKHLFCIFSPAQRSKRGFSTALGYKVCEMYTCLHAEQR